MIACLFTTISVVASANNVKTVTSVTASINLTDTVDLHIISSSSCIADNVIVDIKNVDAWLFFNNIKPSEVIKQYSDRIHINGENFDLNKNVRVAIFRHGAVVIPQGPDANALTMYEEYKFGGASETFKSNYYYTNKRDSLQPENMVCPFLLDNKCHSFILKRGYMVTFANEPNGLGYSRVFVAEDHDLKMSYLPQFLSGKVSFVRVIRWQYSSKKGWCGSYWKEMVSGLQYAPEQCDATNSTWYYNWGTSRTVDPNNNVVCYNQEFVPEKWGAGGSWKGTFSITDSPHLLGYNEPDHTEQSNVSVETAIKEWPNMMKTGLRLGSPATTDFTWLYSFMSEARKRNYRVDYVVVHAYWGGLSGDEWYAKLKDIYDRTGRPLWIKEWNNGANWTKEGWPSGTAAQQAKQLADLKNILMVMDTAHFVERYSIYNWVEDKRAIILKDGSLTPAGEYYTADTPRVAFTHEEEYLPVWTVYDAPKLNYVSYTAKVGLNFNWSDYNGELINKYVFEKRDNNQEFVPLDTITGNEYTLDESALGDKDEAVSFRLESVPIQGDQQTSNVVNVNVINASSAQMLSGRLLITENWLPLIIKEPSSAYSLPLLGVPTYRNKMPLSWRVRNAKNEAFDFCLTTWNYQQNPSLANPDTIAYAVMPLGTYYSGDMTLISDTLNSVNRNWRHVKFINPFTTVPALFTTQITENDTTASSVRIRNVKSDGFDIRLEYEEAVVPSNIDEAVHYVAVTTGNGSFFGKKFSVGITPEKSVGGNTTGGYMVKCGDVVKEGLIFADMQTKNDTLTSVLRIKQRTDTCFTLIKDREKSLTYNAVEPEQVAWMVVYNENLAGINVGSVNSTDDIKSVYDISGKILSNDYIANKTTLPKGVVIAKTKSNKIFKFIK